MFDFEHNSINDNILRITIILLLPIICLYAFYLQFHSEISPGGGFQAGVVLSVAYILFIMIFGINKSEKFMSVKKLLFFSAIGFLIYEATGISTLILGYKFLQYDAFNFLGNGQEIGLFIIELGVGICVFASISTIIFSFYSLAIHKINNENTKDE